MKIVVCIAAFLLCQQSFGQIKKDVNFWTGVGLEMELIKDLSVGLETQVRFNDNASSFNQAYFELSADYKIIKGLNAGLIYRYARKHDDYYFNQNRFAFDLSYRYKLDFGLSFKTRARYQHSFDRLGEVNGIYPSRKNIYRHSFKIAYTNKEFKLISPFVGAEIFHAIQPTNSNAGFLDTYRIKAGVNLDLPKRQSVKLFYTFEHENRAADNRSFIYGIQYNYEFKSLAKKKKKKAKEAAKD
ncbi:MAG: hypothetical protein ACI857_000085 [Arenicella sp.]|jgi:hypothetical protein